MKYWYAAGAAASSNPFVLVMEGSVPNESIEAPRGYWAAMGTKPRDWPAHYHERMDRPPYALRCWPSWPAAPAHLRRHPCLMEGNPTGAMGLADYLGWNWKSKAGLPIVNVPGSNT